MGNIIDASDAYTDFAVHAYGQAGLVGGYHLEKNIFRGGRVALICGVDYSAHNSVLDNHMVDVSGRMSGCPVQARWEDNAFAWSTIQFDAYWGADDRKFRKPLASTFSRNRVTFPNERYLHIVYVTRYTSSANENPTQGGPWDASDEWNDNRWCSTSSPYFNWIMDGADSRERTLAQWQAATGEESRSSSSSPCRSSNETRLFVSDYDSGWANVSQLNFEDRATVEIDPSGFLLPGEAWELRGTQNAFASVLATGTYAGGPISVSAADPAARSRQYVLRRTSQNVQVEPSATAVTLRLRAPGPQRSCVVDVDGRVSTHDIVGDEKVVRVSGLTASTSYDFLVDCGFAVSGTFRTTS